MNSTDEPSVLLLVLLLLGGISVYLISKVSLWKVYPNSSRATILLLLLSLHSSVLSDELYPAVNANARMDNTYTRRIINSHKDMKINHSLTILWFTTIISTIM